MKRPNVEGKLKWTDSVDSVENTADGYVICKCGNDTFWINQPSGQYETWGICTKCKAKYLVHDG